MLLILRPYDSISRPNFLQIYLIFTFSFQRAKRKGGRKKVTILLDELRSILFNDQVIVASHLLTSRRNLLSICEQVWNSMENFGNIKIMHSFFYKNHFEPHIFQRS